MSIIKRLLLVSIFMNGLYQTHLNACGNSLSIYHNPLKNHYVGMIGDHHVDVMPNIKEKAFIDSICPHLNSILQYHRFYDFILEGDDYIAQDVESKFINCYTNFKTPSFHLYNDLLTSLTLLSHKRLSRTLVCESLNFSLTDIHIKAHDLRCTLQFLKALYIEFMTVGAKYSAKAQHQLHKLLQNNSYNNQDVIDVNTYIRSTHDFMHKIQYLINNNTHFKIKYGIDIFNFTEFSIKIINKVAFHLCDSPTLNEVFETIDTLKKQAIAKVHEVSLYKSIWQKFADDFNLLYILLCEIYESYPGIATLQEATNALTPEQLFKLFSLNKTDYKETFIYLFIDRVADFGFLCDITEAFNHKKHALLFAGSLHTDNVGSLLEQMGYKKIYQSKNNDQLSEEDIALFFDLYTKALQTQPQ